MPYFYCGVTMAMGYIINWVTNIRSCTINTMQCIWTGTPYVNELWVRLTAAEKWTFCSRGIKTVSGNSNDSHPVCPQKANCATGSAFVGNVHGWHRTKRSYMHYLLFSDWPGEISIQLKRFVTTNTSYEWMFTLTFHSSGTKKQKSAGSCPHQSVRSATVAR